MCRPPNHIWAGKNGRNARERLQVFAHIRSTAMSMTQQHVFPPLPAVGQPERYYAHKVREADRHGDRFAHEAYKVGQYITLALNTRLTWDQKVKYFQHALHRHCLPPPLPDEETWLFFKSLAALVRQHAGEEALRIASRQDDLYAIRLRMGQEKEKIADDAGVFFARLIPQEHCPEWFNEDDYRQLKMMRDQWI